MPAKRTPTLEFSRTRLLVADFDRSWRFYRDVLGLVPVRGHGPPPYGEFRSPGGAMVSIFDRKLMAEAVGLEPGKYVPKYTGRSALIFEAPDVDAVARQLKRKKVRVVAGPTDRPVWRIRTLHLRDPDGYLIEIFSGMKSPPPSRRPGDPAV